MSLIKQLRAFFRPPSWDEVSRVKYDSPEAICELVSRFIVYSRDRYGDQWQTPRETWARGRGDCEDFALLVRELCRLNGIYACVKVYFPMRGSRPGHAVVVGAGWWSSNGDYREDVDKMDARVADMLDVDKSAIHYIFPSESTLATMISRVVKAACVVACLLSTGCTIVGNGGLLVSANSVSVMVSDDETVIVRDNPITLRATPRVPEVAR